MVQTHVLFSCAVSKSRSTVVFPLSLSFFFSLIIFTLQKIIANYFVNNFFSLCDDSDGIRVVPLLAGGKLWFSLWILSDSAWIWLTPLLLMFLLVLGLRCHSSRLLHYEDSLSSCYIFGTPFYDSVSLLITPFLLSIPETILFFFLDLYWLSCLECTSTAPVRALYFYFHVPPFPLTDT